MMKINWNWKSCQATKVSKWAIFKWVIFCKINNFWGFWGKVSRLYEGWLFWKEFLEKGPLYNTYKQTLPYPSTSFIILCLNLINGGLLFEGIWPKFRLMSTSNSENSSVLTRPLTKLARPHLAKFLCSDFIITI